LQAAQIHLDEGWQVGRQASDISLDHHVTDLAAAGLDARCDFLIDKMQWHLDMDLFGEINALEIQMLNLLTERMVDESAQLHSFFLAIQRHRQHGSVKRFSTQLVVHFVVIHLDHHCIARTVNHAWYKTGLTQTAARTRTLRLACCCIECSCHFLLLHREPTATSRFVQTATNMVAATG
jgi:hypothetical protein